MKKKAIKKFDYTVTTMERQINRNSNILRALYLITELSILIIELS